MKDKSNDTPPPQPHVVGGEGEEIERLRAAMQEAIDMLLERKQGNPARSSSHNARVALQFALTGDVASRASAEVEG